MPRINLTVSRHPLHPLSRQMEAAPILARAFDTAATPDDRGRLHKLNAAMAFIQQVVVGGSTIAPRCNDAFRALGGRSFTELWNDQDVWISFSGDPGDTAFGWSLVGGRDVGLTRATFDRSWRFVAGSLVHELAHINGAPARDSRRAEETLLSCGFADVYDETIVGALSRSSVSRRV